MNLVHGSTTIYIKRTIKNKNMLHKEKKMTATYEKNIQNEYNWINEILRAYKSNIDNTHEKSINTEFYAKCMRESDSTKLNQSYNQTLFKSFYGNSIVSYLKLIRIVLSLNIIILLFLYQFLFVSLDDQDL